MECVYFVRPRGMDYVKIGETECLARRLSNLQSASPVKLEVLGVIPPGRVLEGELHRRFARHWVRGEWFRLDPDVLEYIDRSTDKYAPAPTRSSGRSAASEWKVSRRKRRSRGEGSIYCRDSDGVWVGSVSLGIGNDGKRRRKV